MSVPLTHAQHNAFRAIERLSTALGRSPSRRELAAELGIKGMGRIQEVLEALRERGFVTWLPNRACSLEIVQRGAGYRLPVELQRRLEAFCDKAGELPTAFIADAVADQLDYAETHADEIRGGGRLNARRIA